MKNEEILKKAMEKAISNGMPRLEFNTPASIFSHSFAKAFWGEESFQMKTMKPHSTDYFNEKDELVGAAYHALMSWEYHLQQMVLEEDPIKYLEKFL